MELLHSDISSTILKGFYTVANALPFGLNASFYSNALTVELQSLGLQIDNNKQQQVLYKDKLIGHLNFDIVANNLVVVQVLTQQQMLTTEQVELNKISLKLTDFEVLLILNFGLEAEHKRVFLSNDYKSR